MARFLYAWELGSNFGHLTTFSAVAKELVERGHEVFVALQSLADASTFYDATRVHYLQAPVWLKRPETRNPVQLTYADLIRGFGYTDPGGLSNLVRGWQQLYELVRPDVTACNAAPTALLAARGRDLVTCSLGPGFHSPPQTTPMPTICPWKDVSKNELLKRERDVLSVLNAALENLHQPPLQALCELFDARDKDLLTTFKELDHYQDRPGEPRYCGPNFTVTDGEPAEFPTEGEPRNLFVYVRPSSKHFKPLMDTLRRLKARTLVAAPGLTPSDARSLGTKNMVLYPHAIRLDSVLPQCHAAVCVGGHGTIAACLLEGVPLVLLPNHIEQILLARAVAKTGCGIMPKMDASTPPYGAMLKEVLTRSRYRNRALGLKDKYSDFRQERQGAKIADELERLCRR